MSGILSLSDLNTTVNHEPRILDTLLAKKLGMARPRKIRELIERNLDELSRYGTCPTAGRVVRGNEVAEYYLNEPQALLICIKSDAPKAPDVRQAIIEVFMAYRRGDLAPATLTPEQQNALQRAIKARHDATGHPFPALWGRFNNHFKLGSYKQLPPSRMTEALAYIAAMQVPVAALPAPAAQPALMPVLARSPEAVNELLYRAVELAFDVMNDFTGSSTSVRRTAHYLLGAAMAAHQAQERRA